MRKEIPSVLGWSCSKAAPAPSESINLKKSFSKAMMASPSSCEIWLASSLKYLASIHMEKRSDPAQTAFEVLPDNTERYPNFSACIPALHAPVDELISTAFSPR